jgi:ATP-binding cassette subfamily B multidrug efflux pump
LNGNNDLKKKTTDISEQPTIQRISFADIKDLLLPIFRQHRLRLVIGFTALVGVDFLQLTIPRIIKRGVDGIESQLISANGLLKLGLIILTIASFVVLLRFTWRYLIIGFSRLLERAVRNRIFSHILKMDAPFFDQHTTGDLMAHSSNDLAAVQMACGMGMVAAVDSLVMSIAAIGFMIAIHPQLTLLALLPMPILALATRILSGKLHKRFATVQQQFSLLTEFSRSTLISIGLIKGYTMEGFQTDRFDALGRDYVSSNLKVARIQGLISPLATLVGSTAMLIIIYFGGKLVIQSVISLGDFVAFITYLYMLIWPMMAIGWVANLVQRGLTSLGRIHNLLNSRPVLCDPPPVCGQQRLHRPGFILKGLNFSYAGSSSPALTDISLELGPGIHGITGRTGCGKSTLCKILTRLYPVADGTLFIDDRDVNTLPLDYIRSHIAYVSQEPTLFSNTIHDNLVLGRPEASLEDVISAAKQAAIHDDIMGLADGYQTMTGERGVKLSGGQRQRLALARALLCNRPVLVIDDGLSAVDVATEHDVFQGLRENFRDKTVIIVSNRIKLLSMTDRIIILDNGAVDIAGSHQQLLEKNQLYKTMYDKQMKAEISEGAFTP